MVVCVCVSGGGVCSCEWWRCVQVEAYSQKIAEEMEKLNAMETDENRE